MRSAERRTLSLDSKIHRYLHNYEESHEDDIYIDEEYALEPTTALVSSKLHTNHNLDGRKSVEATPGNKGIAMLRRKEMIEEGAHSIKETKRRKFGSKCSLILHRHKNAQN